MNRASVNEDSSGGGRWRALGSRANELPGGNRTMTTAIGITLLIGVALGVVVGVPVGRAYERVRPKKKPEKKT